MGTEAGNQANCVQIRARNEGNPMALDGPCHVPGMDSVSELRLHMNEYRHHAHIRTYTQTQGLGSLK